MLFVVADFVDLPLAPGTGEGQKDAAVSEAGHSEAPGATPG